MVVVVGGKLTWLVQCFYWFNNMG